MRTEKIEIKGMNTIQAYLQVYLHECSAELRDQNRPMVLLCPGGGYEFLSDREGDILALQFMAMGYHAAVLHYSVAPAVYPTALTELACAMQIIRSHSEEWNILEGKVYVLGCSAGGHLAASLGVKWKEKWLGEFVGADTEILRPDGLILCYPVITSGEYAHRGSFDALLRGIQTQETLDDVSLELHVNSDTPETFIWHTWTDGLVPVENSLLFVNALRKAGVNTEFHLYHTGGHGLSTAKAITRTPDWNEVQPECQDWLKQCEMWLNNHTGWHGEQGK